MSYSSRNRYKSRREKNIAAKANAKRILVAAVCIAIVLLVKNRQYIYDYVRTSMY